MKQTNNARRNYVRPLLAVTKVDADNLMVNGAGSPMDPVNTALNQWVVSRQVDAAGQGDAWNGTGVTAKNPWEVSWANKN